MTNLPSNWDALESEYNKHYDPLADKCPECGSEDLIENPGELFIKCANCGHDILED